MKKDLNEPIHNRVQSVYLLKVQLSHKSLNKAQNMVFYKVGFSTNTHNRFDMFLKDKDLGISQIDFIDGIYAKTAKEVEKFIHKEIITNLEGINNTLYEMLSVNKYTEFYSEKNKELVISIFNKYKKDVVLNPDKYYNPFLTRNGYYSEVSKHYIFVREKEKDFKLMFKRNNLAEIYFLMSSKVFNIKGNNFILMRHHNKKSKEFTFGMYKDNKLIKKEIYSEAYYTDLEFRLKDEPKFNANPLRKP